MHDAIAVTRRQARRFDELAQEKLGIPGLVLMENAGINATNAMLDWLGDVMQVAVEDARVAVVCGGGNNGGDGYVIARHLHNWGVRATIYAAADPAGLKGDAAVNGAICTAMGLPIVPVWEAGQIEAAAARWAEVDLIVDALLGTGFHGEVREPLASLIGAINRTPRRTRWNAEETTEYAIPSVVAVDIPSGLDCDTGRPGNATVRADLTVTFVAEKVGFAAEEAAAYLGHVIAADIGAPMSLLEEVMAE